MRPTELIDLLVKAQMLVEESADVFEWKPTMEKTEIFAKLVATKEIEACAKFFDDNDTNIFWGSEAARFIRARGEQA